MGEKPTMAAIKKVVQETPSIRTIHIDYALNAKPGQFAMVWIPSIDEKPFTLTAIGKECAITVQRKGKFTEKMFALKEGDKIGIRGPYGNGFGIKGVKRACIIAGGCGAAPILLLAKELAKKKTRLKIILGARTSTECLFKKTLAETSDLHITTDDGTLGEKGFTTQALEKLLQKENFDCVFSCGPEQMLAKVFELCEKHKTKCQLNLERFCKCSVGVCGQCAINEFLACRDGPVFGNEQLRKMPDFGKFALLKSTKKVSLEEYSNWRQE